MKENQNMTPMLQHLNRDSFIPSTHQYKHKSRAPGAGVYLSLPTPWISIFLPCRHTVLKAWRVSYMKHSFVNTYRTLFAQRREREKDDPFLQFWCEGLCHWMNLGWVLASAQVGKLVYCIAQQSGPHFIFFMKHYVSKNLLLHNCLLPLWATQQQLSRTHGLSLKSCQRRIFKCHRKNRAWWSLKAEWKKCMWGIKVLL